MRRPNALLAAAALLLLAASPAKKHVAIAAGSKASGVAAADGSAIKGLISQIYANYKHIEMRPGVGAVNPTPARIGLAVDDLFTPSTRAIADENTRLLKGEMGDIGADIFIDAQDNGTVKVRSISLAPRPDGRVAATVVFDDAEMRVHNHRKTIVWERTPAGWRVYDISLQGQGTYRTVMLAENRRLGGTGQPASMHTSNSGKRANLQRAAVGAPLGSGGTARPAPLKPFDLTLVKSSPPLGSHVEWTGMLLSTDRESKAVAVTLDETRGKLVGSATSRGLMSGLSRTMPASGSVKAGVCSLKIEGSSYKGRCSQAGFWGASGFLGTVDGFAMIYAGGAEAIARAGRDRPARVLYAGKAISPSGYESLNIFELEQSGGYLSGRQTNNFGYGPAIGAMFDGSCALVHGKVLYVGTCDDRAFIGNEYYKVDTPEMRFALAAGASAEQAMRVAIDTRQGQVAQYLQSRAEQQQASTLPAAGQDTGDNTQPPPGTSWAYGRDRWVVVPGRSCSSEMRLWKNYCFDEVIAFLKANLSQKDVTVIALTQAAPLGTFIGNDTAIRYKYVEVSRVSNGFKAEADLHGTNKVRVPMGCDFASLREGFVVTDGTARGLKEASLFRCP